MREPRGGVGWRAQQGTRGVVGVLGSGVVALARLIMTIAVLIFVLIALAIILRDVGANSANTIVKGLHEGANFFAGAFTGLIAFSGHPKRAITVDWGIAAIVYLIVGVIVSGYVKRIGVGGLRLHRSHRAALR
ncbi:MAG: hypothetical protein ACRDK2_04795 [Solirubrobacteraceae bacterium]